MKAIDAHPFYKKDQFTNPEGYKVTSERGRGRGRGGGEREREK